jgi:peroxiredoxin
MKKAITLGVAFAILASGAMAASGNKIKVGAKAPMFSCPLLSDKQEDVSLKECLNEGKVVVLSFFHTTCKPCIREIPILTKILESKAGKPIVSYLVFVGNEDDSTLRAFLKDHNFTLPVLKDRYGYRIGEPYKVVANEMASVPHLVVISKNGVVKGSWSGFQEGLEEKLGSLLDQLVAEEKEAAAVSAGVTILFTNNTNGMVKAAPGIEVGGLARRATVVKRERALGNVLLVDGGDFMPTSPDVAKSNKVVAAMAKMGYDAVAIGEAEFVNGLAYLRALAKGKKLPLVSANVKQCKGEDVCSDIVRSTISKEVGGKKVAIFSYTSEDAFGFTPEERLKAGKWYVKIVDYKSPLKGFIESKRKDNDLLVVISHAGIEADQALAAEYPEIDVIVGAHSQTFLNQPTRVGKTVIAQAAGDGQYVGKLVIKFDENNKPAPEAYELIPLTKTVAENEEVKDAIANTTAEAADPKDGEADE